MVTRVLLALVLSLSIVNPGGARHTNQTPHTDGTAHTLNGGEWRAGVFTIERGLFDRMEVGTIYWLWLLKVSNVFTKVKVLDTGHTVVSLTGGITWANAREFSDSNPDVTLYSANVGIFGSRIMDPFTFSLGAILTELGHTELRNEELDIGGALRGTGGVLRPQVEYRMSELTALILDSNIQYFRPLRRGLFKNGIKRSSHMGNLREDRGRCERSVYLQQHGERCLELGKF